MVGVNCSVKYSSPDDRYDSNVLYRVQAAIIANLLLYSGHSIYRDFFGPDVDTNERLQRAFDEKMQFIGPAGGNRRLITSSGNEYRVSLASCSCPDHQYRKIPCKHMYRLAIDCALALPAPSIVNAPPPRNTLPSITSPHSPSSSPHATHPPSIPIPPRAPDPPRTSEPQCGPESTRNPDPPRDPVRTVVSPNPKQRARRHRPLLFLFILLLFLAPFIMRHAAGHPNTVIEPYRKDDNSPHIIMASEILSTPIPTPTPSPTPRTTPRPSSSGSTYFGDPSTYTGYIGNANTHKFHKPTCSYLPAESNQVIFETREEAIEAGYVPCGRCHP